MSQCWTYDLIDELLFMVKEERMNTLFKHEVDAFEITTRSKISLVLLLNLRWMKGDIIGGRKDRNIELGMRFMERRREHDNMMNTVTFPTKENDFIY